MTGRQPWLSAKLQGFGTTIFAEMSALATRTGAVNLGQGFPDTDGPPEMLDAAVRAIREGHNQYPPGPGIPELRAAVAAHQKRCWGLDVDPDGGVLITAGATEALTAALLALCEVGDEVLTFEPTYDSYRAAAAMAGASLRVVTLEPPDYAVDPDTLAAAVTPRTRLVLLNTPHNPTGKVFSRTELEAIARLCREHDLAAVTDEVYEHIVFEGEHRPLAGLPGMGERTLTISSAGKTFSCTGWKIGWACGPADLVTAVRTAKQFLTYVNGGPFQHAVVTALELGDAWFGELQAELAIRRDLLCTGLSEVGLEVYPPQGSYFVTADVRPLGWDDGVAFCRALPELCGVAAVPSAAFYADPERGRHLVRFTVSKRREVLEEAVARLGALR